MLRVTTLVVGLLASLPLSLPAHAELICKKVVHVQGTAMKSKGSAQFVAISAWEAKAQVLLGPVYGNWNTAYPKKLTCHRINTTGFYCFAKARACTNAIKKLNFN